MCETIHKMYAEVHLKDYVKQACQNDHMANKLTQRPLRSNFAKQEYDNNTE